MKSAVGSLVRGSTELYASHNRSLWFAQPQLRKPVCSGIATAAVIDLVAEDDLQKRCVGQLLSPGQGDALGQGGGHGSQFEVLVRRFIG